MIRKMGADAWGAAEIGSKAPIGAAAMGGSETGPWVTLLGNTRINAESSGGAPLAYVYYGGYKPFGYPDLRIVFDGTEYIVPRADYEDKARFGALPDEKGLDVYDFGEYPFGISNAWSADGGFLVVACENSGPHTIAVYHDRSYSFELYQELTNMAEASTGPLLVRPEQTALPPRNRKASILFYGRERSGEVVLSPVQETGPTVREYDSPQMQCVIRYLISESQGGKVGAMADAAGAVPTIATYILQSNGEE